jgi:hypothetical protein
VDGNQVKPGKFTGKTAEWRVERGELGSSVTGALRDFSIPKSGIHLMVGVSLPS